MESLTTRLAALEKRVRILSTVLAFVLVTALVLLCADSGDVVADASKEGGSVVEAREFRLVGANGNLLGRWGSARVRELPSLRMYDDGGTETVSLLVSGSGCGGLFVYSGKEKTRVALMAEEDQSAGLFLRVDDVFRATFAIDKTGVPLLFVKEAGDQGRAPRLRKIVTE
jgi:hypothetical protein